MSRVAKLNEAQLTAKESESWHLDYKDSAYIYAGGLSYELTEGDVVCIFSQYGEILDVNLIRDKKTGASKGFAFLRYEDERSTILAVDNLSGAKVLGRSLRVDHVSHYKQPKRDGESVDDWEQDPRASMNVAPAALLTEEQRDAPARKGHVAGDQEESTREDYGRGIDPEDPMYEYLVNERREAALRAKKASTGDRGSRGHRSHRHRSRSPGRRHESREERRERSDRSHRHREHGDRNGDSERDHRRHRSRS